MTKRRFFAALFLGPAALALALGAVLHQIREIHDAPTTFELKATSDSVIVGVGQHDYRPSELTALADQVQFPADDSEGNINGVSNAVARATTVGQVGQGPAHRLSVTISFAGLSRSSLIVYRHLPDRKGWFEIRANPIKVQISSTDGTAYPVKSPGRPILTATGPSTFSVRALRFGLAENDQPSSRPFDVSSVQFVDPDADIQSQISTLRAGSIMVGGEPSGETSRLLNEGDPLRVGPIEDGRIDFLRLSDDGITIRVSGRVRSLSIDHRREADSNSPGVTEDLMPARFVVVMPTWVKPDFKLDFTWLVPLIPSNDRDISLWQLAVAAGTLLVSALALFIK